VPQDEIVRRASYGPGSPVVGERGAQTREAIVAAALALFDERGFHATPVDDIAEAAGISRAGLYQYFESKEQLFVELLRECGSALLRVVRRLGPLGPTAAGYDNLHWWVGEWAWVYDKYATMFVQWANVESPRAPLRPLIEQWTDAYAARMTQRLDASGLQGLDPHTAAMVLLAMINRTNYCRHTSLTRGLAPEEILDTLATVAQLMLFPSTPADALAPERPTGSFEDHRPRSPNGRRARETVTPAPGGAPRARGGDRLLGAGARAQATTARLLDAGAKVFTSHSFHVASVDDVLAEAGLGRGTFYKYFDGKLDLLLVLAVECFERLRELSDSFAEITPGVQRSARLRAWLGDFVPFQRRYAGVLRAWIEQEPRDASLQAMGRDIGETTLAAFDTMLARVRRRYPFSIPAGSLILLALLERAPAQLLGSRDDLGSDELAGLLAGVVERGLLNGQTRRSTRTTGSARA
jgi:AcrR family transcriptional regulator